jgi:KipI family sensor histidine kinase inhibitor
VLPCGDAALIVEVDGIGDVLALRAAVERAGPARLPGLLDVVPGATTLLLVAQGPPALPRLRAGLETLLSDPAGWSAGADPAPDPATLVRVEVRYDGEDLAEVARHTGLTPAEVVAAHTGRTWAVAFGGFAPGFAYLTGGDERLEVPRRSEPRTRVPAGAVGLAGAFSGIYPRPSPGGWQIIGRTEARLWDVDRDPPALLRPGIRVQFVAIGRER